MREGVGRPQLSAQRSNNMQTCIVHVDPEPAEVGAIRTLLVVTASTMAIDTGSRPPKAAPGAVADVRDASLSSPSGAALAWLSAQSQGTSGTRTSKRPHPEAYEVTIQSSQLHASCGAAR